MNEEARSARLRARVASLVNELMNNHVLLQPPFTTSAQAGLVLPRQYRLAMFFFALKLEYSSIRVSISCQPFRQSTPGSGCIHKRW